MKMNLKQAREIEGVGFRPKDIGTVEAKPVEPIPGVFKSYFFPPVEVKE